MFLAFSEINDKANIEVKSGVSFSFDGEIIEAAFRRIFGENVKYENGNFKYPRCKFKDGKYTCDFDARAGDGYSSKIVSAYKYSDKIEINVNVELLAGDQEDKLGNYKYTFKKENANYYFYSVEKVK